MIIDAHHHFWRLGQFDTRWLETPEHAPIRRDYEPRDLKPLIDASGVSKTVFVQTQHDLEETRWVLSLADAHDWICGVVGWVDLASDACGQQLDELTAHPKFVGVRHVTQDEPDDDFIIRPDVIQGLRELERRAVPFDLLFYVRHLRHAVTLARELPELPMVIDHLSKPHIKAGRLDDWEPQFRAAAACPNLMCKISGMITEADWQAWTVDDLRPYVEIALDAFGPERLMFGSDWPVCELAGTYPQVFHACSELISGLTETERTRILGGTAQDFYRLSL